MRINLVTLAALAAGGYVLYKKSATGAWPWEKAPATPGQYTISLYDPSRTMGEATTKPNLNSAHTIYDQYRSKYPTYKMTLTGPDGSIISQIDALTA